MSWKTAVVCLILPFAVLMSGCSPSEQDKYSYHSIQDDEFAQTTYLADQRLLVDGPLLESQGGEMESWIRLQTEQICDQLTSGSTTFDALVQFFDGEFGDLVSDAEQFVGNAAGFSCSGYLD